MIARKKLFLLAVVVSLVTMTALGEAATYWTSYGSGGSWSSYNYDSWGWYQPTQPSKPTQPTQPTKPTQPQQPSEPQKPPAQEPAPVAGLTEEENLALSKINQERAALGRAPLKVNMELVRLARLKSQDMAEKGYFDHVSPTYGSVYDMLDASGIRYKFAGENIGRGSSVTILHNAFMESSGHRANIVSAGYSEVGVGVYKKGRTVYITHIFIKPRS